MSQPDWSLDREIVITELLAAPRALVFEAWTNPEHLVKWFGPDGFEVENIECDVRVGGCWRFNYHSAEHGDYSNRMEFVRIEPPSLIQMWHGSDVDDDPARFFVTVTFDEQSDGKTVLTLRQLHPSKAQRDGAIGFGAVEFGYQTVGKLERYVAGMKG